MNARILTTATLFTAFAGVLTARAADSQLLALVMPDAKMVAGVNVDQAKGTPFGLYVLTQMQTDSQGLKQLIAMTGFDPTKDVHELLAASNATPGSKTPTGLLLGRGNFDIATITEAAISKGALTETYGGLTILEDPKKTAGLAFSGPTLAMVGDLASVKAAIDRPGTGQSLPTSVLAQISQWSGTEDAWFVTTVAPGTLIPSGMLGGNAVGLLQQVQQASAGVKFGNNVVGSATLQTDTAANATQMSNALQFLVNMMQMQAQNNPQIAILAKGIAVSSTGTAVNLTITLPQAQFQQLIQQKGAAAHVGMAK